MGRVPGPRLPAVAVGAWFLWDPMGFFATLRRRYGDVFAVTFPAFGRVVWIADPALVKEVFTGDPDVFRAGEANARVLEPALGPYSLLSLDGAEHLRQRRLLLPPFHGARMERYGEIIREVAGREVAGWPRDREFPLRPRMEAITLAVILRAVFGVRGDQRLEVARRVIGEFARRAHALLMVPLFQRRIAGMGPWDRFLRARDALDAFIYEEIAARRREPDTASREDVLSLLLQATHEDGAPMSDAELRDELVTVIGAGHETTATALAWAFERLLRTPDVLATLRSRLDDDAYLDAVVKETLRARPVITDVARKITRPVSLGGYDFPAGSILLPAIAVLHHREDLFEQPERFMPERFLDGQADGYAWIPFGGGVRRCVGASFAQYEMRIVLRTVLERVDLVAPDPRPERPRPRNITLSPARGTRVGVRSFLATSR